MSELGFNTVRVSEFAWADIQPSENVFDFSTFRKVADYCKRERADRTTRRRRRNVLRFQNGEDLPFLPYASENILTDKIYISGEKIAMKEYGLYFCKKNQTYKGVNENE